MRKLTLTIIAVLSTVLLIFQSTEVQPNLVQPQAGRTGAPDELTCGDGVACHNTDPNTGPGSVTISFSGTNNEYVPGSTYELTFTVAEAGMVDFGFECTSIDANGDSVGLWKDAVQGDVAYPTVFAVNHRKYVSHHNASANNVWIVNWKAPVTDKGALTFYAAGNAGNGDTMSIGDHIYTTSLTITTQLTGIYAVGNNHSNFVIQNFSDHNLNVQYLLENNERMTICLYDINGQLVNILLNANEAPGTHIKTLNLGYLAAGLYFVQFRSETISHTEKIIVQ